MPVRGGPGGALFLGHDPRNPRRRPQPTAASSGVRPVGSSSAAVTITPLTSLRAARSRSAASSMPTARAAPRPARSMARSVSGGMHTPGTSLAR